MYGLFYLFGAASFFAVFLITLLSPGYRRVAFWTALACAPAGAIGELWLIPGYWSPEYLVPLVSHPFRFGLEDLIITSAFAGICAAVFEYCARQRGFTGVPPMSARTFLAMEGYGLIGCIIMVFCIMFFNLTTIHSLFLSISIVLFILVRSCIARALVMIPLAVTIAFCYMAYMIFSVSLVFPGVITMFWNLPGTWGVLLFGVPAEELVWAFLTAMYCGMIYRIAATTPFPFGRRFWMGIRSNAGGLKPAVIRENAPMTKSVRSLFETAGEQ